MRKLFFFLIIFLFPSVLFSQSWEELNKDVNDCYERGDYKTALDYAEKCLIQAEKEFGKMNENYAESLNDIAEIYRVMGHLDKVETLLKEALKIKKELLGEKNSSYAVTLSNLALFYDNIGQYEKSETLYLEVIEIDNKVFGVNNLDYASDLHNLASLYMKMGKYEKAESLYNKALEIRKSILGDRHPKYAESLNGIATFYYELGQYEKTKKLFKEALKIEKETISDKSPIYANTLNNLAMLYGDIGNYEKAELLYKEAIEIRKKSFGERSLDYAVSINNLADLYRVSKQYEKVEPLLLEAINIKKEIYGNIHISYAVSLNNLACFYTNIQQYKKAEILFKEVLNIKKALLDEKSISYTETLINLAILYENSLEFEKAEPFYLQAVSNYIYQLRNNFPFLSENQKTKFLEKIYINFDHIFNFSVKRYKDNQNISSDILDIDLVLKGIILNSAVQMLNKINNSNDDNLKIYYNNLVTLRTEIIRALDLTLKEREKNGINLNRLESDAETLEKELTKMTGIEIQKSDWKRIKNYMGFDEAAVEFVDFHYSDNNISDKGYYYAIIIKPESQHPLLIKLFDLDSVKNILSLQAENRNSYIININVSNKLYSFVWLPLEKYLTGIKNIYVSPTGILNKVSFYSLQFADGNYLIDKYNLKFVGNLNDIPLIKDFPNSIRNISDFKASIFGGANFDIDSVDLIRNAERFKTGYLEKFSPASDIIIGDLSHKTISKWNYLRGTLEEVNIIKSIFEKENIKVEIYEGYDATEESFKSLSSINSPTLLHVSTHGFFFPEIEKKIKKSELLNLTGQYKYKMSDNPLMRSGLILAGANWVWTGGQEIEGVENGILTAYEVSNMDLQNTDLVVLSACETGLGDIKGGEGVYGLQRAFKIAGAKTIIMSLWKVPDKETVELMELFYTNWLGGMTKHDAFTSAQKEMRKKYAPYYWAAFVMVE